MKNIYKLLLAGAILSTTAACSEDYLNLGPESSVTKDMLFQSPVEAQYVVNGLGRIMSTQYLDTQGYNGEGTVYTYNGEYPGDCLEFGNKTGWQNIIKQNYNSSSNTNVQFGWYYYYKLIGNANQVICNVPEVDGGSTANQWKHVKAQALTYRAYAYTMLSQLFSRRWSDMGANGLQRGVILRLDESNDAMPCSTMGEVFAQIYADLDEAIRLFGECGITRSNDANKRWQANINVAHAVYTRAALIREDWNTVIAHAAEARKGYSIMGITDYMAGFNTATKEWIWEVFEDETQPMHYYSFYNYASASCLGSNSRTYPPIISKQIIDAVDPADERMAIYAIPTADELPAAKAAKLKTAGNVSSGAFYDRVKKEFKSRIYSTTTIFYYLATKFIVKSGTGDGCIPIFRAAEMYYAEAEAQYHLGNEGAAKTALEATVKPYNSAYTCTKTGAALFNEIKAYRKFDLANEGHSWFDLKRWGDPMVRKTWAEGGNWRPEFAGVDTDGTDKAGNYGPEAKNRWTPILPNTEANYNPLITKFEDINPDGTWNRVVTPDTEE